MIKLPAFFRSPRVLVLIAPFVLLAPVWLAGKALYWGTPSTQFIPWWWQARQTLVSGELPLWNPMLGMGAPLLANYQSAFLYPPNWLYLLLAVIGGLPWMAWGMAILVASHLAWAGWGMVRLVQKFGYGELAQTISGLAFSLSGYLVARAHFLSVTSAVAWLPWIMLAAYDAASQPKNRGSVLKLGFFLGLQWLAGHAQVSWYTLLLAIAWLTFWALNQRSDLLKTWTRFAAAVAFGFALAAIQLLPTIEYLQQSQRAAQVDPQLALTYSFWPWRFITLLAPNFFGNPAYGNYWGYGNFWEDAIYVGLIPLFLAVSALIFVRRKGVNRNLVFFLATVSFVSFILALGNNTAVFPWLFDHVPSFNLFQGPTRLSILAIFSLSLLAAIAADRWRVPGGRGLYWSRLAVAGAVAILIGALLLGFANSTGSLLVEPTFIRATATTAVVALGVAFLNLRAPSEKQENFRWTWLVALLLTIDLLFAGWGLNPGVDLSFYRQDPNLHAVLKEQLGGGRLYFPPADEKILKFDHLFRFDDFNSEDPRTIRTTLLPNITILDAIPSANNFDPLLPARYQDWLVALEDSPPEVQSQMIARMGVTAVEHLNTNEGASVSFDPTLALPRTRWVNCARVAPNTATALSAVQSAYSDPAQEIVVESADFDEADLCGSADAGSAQINFDGANRVAISVSSPGGGWLILADSFYPGWRAFVDGDEVTIYPADGLFRAIKLPPGEHQVEFVYRPLSFTTGAAISALAWLLLIILVKYFEKRS